MDSAMGCRSAEERDLSTSYLAGRLTPQEAEDFEQHYFGCERCWEEVRTQSELRAAIGNAPVAPIRLRQAPAVWSAVAAAAVVSIAALCLWQIAARGAISTDQVVMRGADGEAMPVAVERLPDQRVRLTWRSERAAQTYRVEVLRSDGVPVWERETEQTSLTLDFADVPPVARNVSLLTRVEALDPMRQVVASSVLTKIKDP